MKNAISSYPLVRKLLRSKKGEKRFSAEIKHEGTVIFFVDTPSKKETEETLMRYIKKHSSLEIERDYKM